MNPGVSTLNFYQVRHQKFRIMLAVSYRVSSSLTTKDSKARRRLEHYSWVVLHKRFNTIMCIFTTLSPEDAVSAMHQSSKVLLNEARGSKDPECLRRSSRPKAQVFVEVPTLSARNTNRGARCPD